ncbi:MAG: flagellar hook-length control protein FliK [Syntrophales bacterium]|nr:flagellar hook-length control protein FliK [Syntrophales bacterium]
MPELLSLVSPKASLGDPGTLSVSLNNVGSPLVGRDELINAEMEIENMQTFEPVISFLLTSTPAIGEADGKEKNNDKLPANLSGSCDFAPLTLVLNLGNSDVLGPKTGEIEEKKGIEEVTPLMPHRPSVKSTSHSSEATPDKSKVEIKIVPLVRDDSKEKIYNVLEISISKQAAVVGQEKETNKVTLDAGRIIERPPFSPIATSEVMTRVILQKDEKPRMLTLNVSVDEEGGQTLLFDRSSSGVASLRDTIKAILTARGMDEEMADEVAAQIKKIVHYYSPRKEGVKEILDAEKEVVKAQDREIVLPEKDRKVSFESVLPKIRVSDNTKTDEKVFALDAKGLNRLRSKPLTESSDHNLVASQQGVHRYERVIFKEEIMPSAVVRQEEIIAQVNKAVETFGDKAGRLQILLEPPHLGEVEMEVVVRGDRVRAIMVSENEQVRQVLKNHVEEIKQVLMDQGLKIERVEVRAPEEKQLPQWMGNGYRQEKESHRPPRGGDRDGRKKDATNFANYLITTV